MSLAKLWEEGKLDLDAPIQTYVKSFPEKTFNGATVTLTTRHLLSHLGGIRHYEKNSSNTVNKVCVLEREVAEIVMVAAKNSFKRYFESLNGNPLCKIILF